MASIDTAREPLISPDAWTWWQARRLTYNLALAAAGWLAYFAAVGLNYAYGQPIWRDPRGALGVTLFLGCLFLMVMGVANVCFLLGPALEGWIRPPDVTRYRRAAWRMGLWGSACVPFLFPLMQSAVLLANR